MPAFMKYDSIYGDVTEPAHRGWIEVMSFQFGVGRGLSNPTGGSADRESSAPSVSEIVVTKKTDAASTRLRNESFRGEPTSAIIEFVKEGRVYLRYEMSDTMVSGYSLSGGGDRPTESLTLNFTKVEYKSNPGTPPPLYRAFPRG
jgi:type VI secretion system secreted protein Hcp